MYSSLSGYFTYLCRFRAAKTRRIHIIQTTPVNNITIIYIHIRLTSTKKNVKLLKTNSSTNKPSESSYCKYNRNIRLKN